jgi:hypothetical protein
VAGSALAALVAVHAQAALAQAPPGSEIQGVYTGHYICSQRQTSLQLTLEAGGPPGVSGVFTFFPPGGDAAKPTGAFRVAGTFDPQTNSLRLQPREWVKPAPLYMTVGLSGTYDRASSTIKGTIAAPGCVSFEVKRDPSATARIAEAAASRVSRYENAPTALSQARTPDEQCLTLGKWLTKFTREYPDVDIQRSMADQLQVRSVNLFGDADFVPVFGKPFDQISESERTAPRQAVQTCTQWGDNRDYRTMFGVVLVRAFLPSGPGPGDIASMVAYRRTLRQQRVQLLAELKALDGSDVSLKRAAAIRDSELTNYEVLWPSEYSELSKALDATFARVASPGLEAWVAGVVKGASGLQGLTAINEALAHFSAKPTAAALPGARPSIKPPGSAAAAAPSTGPAALVAAASPEVRERAEQQLRARATTLVTELAGAETAKLKSLGTGLAALQAGTAWHAQFSQSFANFQSEPSVRDGFQALEARRRQDLAAASDELLARVNQAKTPADVAGVLATYLGVPSDRSEPAASRVFAAADEKSRTLTASAERAAEEARSVTNFCRKLSATDKGAANREPSSRDMCLAVADLMDSMNDQYRSTKASCERGNYRDNPVLAVQCLGLYAGTGGTGDMSVQMTYFEKIACASAEATGQPGFNCDYVLRYSASNPAIQKAMASIAPFGSVIQSRFVQRGDRWMRMTR